MAPDRPPKQPTWEQIGHLGRNPVPALLITAGLALITLWFHSSFYSFHCDDAYISFRYARNLAEGNGLVFNPGFERIEGYTNFLWVIILAFFARLGVPPDAMASPLSLLLSLGLSLWLVLSCWRHRPPGASPWWLLVPAVFLGTNRSFAVWSTGGLETRLFEFLIVGGVLTSLDEMAALRKGGGVRAPWSILFLALATLTRPDGLLIAVSVIGLRIILQRRDRTLHARPLAIGAAIYIGLVGGHFLFRHLYYGEWLPNTYYAKVGGRVWWDMGVSYLASFALEYGLISWLPLLVAAATGLGRAGRADIPLLVAATIVPHAVYVAAVAPDHFEYRILGLYVPMIVLLVYCGASALGTTRFRSLGVAGYLVFMLLAWMTIPILTHLDAPTQYRPGFPGGTGREDGRKDIILPEQHPWTAHVPGIRRYLRLYNDLIQRTTSHYVGIRQEEHLRFLATAKQQGLWLRELVDSGRLPVDLYIATDCVGAIPYYSRLRTLDRLGLTDREIARRPTPAHGNRMIAHEKGADPEYAVRRGVDLWAVDRVYLVVPLGYPQLHFATKVGKYTRWVPMFADVGGGRYLLGYAMQGAESLHRRCPSLDLRPAAAYLAIDSTACRNGFVPVLPQAQLGAPYDIAYYNMSVLMSHAAGDPETARLYLERALATNPRNPLLTKKPDWLDAQAKQPVVRQP